jgi:rfaE bifunctional protein nucleotidyltransferase chain/domain/rfaE bifunctional protein kinase chain/domain
MNRIVVVGDALLDRDVLGTVDRLCPDAPAPVFEQRELVERPGGAALAALLAARGGTGVTLLSPIGDDSAGARLSDLLRQAGVTVAPWRDPAPTIEKERVLVRERSIVRLDRGGGARVLPEPACDVVRHVLAADAVLVSDYGRGASTVAMIRHAIGTAVEHGTPVVWDPHPKGPHPVPGVSLVTPNTHELRHFDAGSRADDDMHGSEVASLVAAARRLLAQWRPVGLCVTRGSQGAVLVTEGGLPLVVPVDDPDVDPVDTCGAGDAFAAQCAVAFASGAVMSEAVQSAVQHAAGYVASGGAVGLREVEHRRPSTARPSHAGAAAKVVATGGCFDLLHAGHVAMLQRARQLGDRLVVLLNSDESVRRLKGPGRPIQAASDRAAVLRSLECVDDVVVFDGDTPIEALRRLRPQVFVKGADYSSATLPEVPVLAGWGGVVVTVPYLAGRSTTTIVEHIEASHVV